MTANHGTMSSALYDLEAAAYDLAQGRTVDAPKLVGRLASDDLRGGASLVGILRATAPFVDASAVARRQFFHAARALVALHRNG